MSVTNAPAGVPRHLAAADHPRRPRATTLAVAIIVLGLVLRLGTLATPHIFFPDEIFQYLEQAHRVAFGHGIVPWEYRVHARSWLVPLALAAPMRIGDMIAPESGAYLLLPRIMLLALSMSAIPAAGMIGRRISPLHGLLAMLVAATWVEFVYFSTIALTDPIAAFLFIAAAALLYRRAEPTRGSLIGAGSLLALTCLVRFQYGPAVAVLGVASVVRRPDRFVWLAIGALPPLLVSILTDLAMHEGPFHWFFVNIHQNITLGRSHAWVDGPFFYPATLASLWGIWLLPLVALAIVGARRFPALFVAAATNILVHSAIAHKEYRYILLTTMITAILAAIGSGDILRWVWRRSDRSRMRYLPWIVAAGWLMASASVADGREARPWWTQEQPAIAAFSSLHDMHDLCGVAIFGFNVAGSGGYTYLHRPVPFFAYAADEQAGLQRDAAQFNAIVAPSDHSPPIGFGAPRCFATSGQETLCTYTRPGKCAATTSPAEINRQLGRPRRS